MCIRPESSSFLPGTLLDQARVLAGQTTATFKLPVSRQIVLRALIGEGLKRGPTLAFLSNVDRQAQEVRHTRSGGRGRGPVQTRGDEAGGRRRK